MRTGDIKKLLIEEYEAERFKFDKKKQQKYIELLNVSFINDDDWILEHDHHVTDEQWYKENYEPLIGTQFIEAMKKIIDDPCTRQAYIQLLDPNADPMICTIGMHYIFDPKTSELSYLVNMRSNSVTEFTMDSIWQLKMFSKGINYLYDNLDHFIRPGYVYWHVDSLHLYEEDFKYLKFK